MRQSEDALFDHTILQFDTKYHECLPLRAGIAYEDATASLASFTVDRTRPEAVLEGRFSGDIIFLARRSSTVRTSTSS